MKYLQRLLEEDSGCRSGIVRLETFDGVDPDFVRVVNMYRILLPPSNIDLEIEWTLVVTQQS